jgi:hypothetical protein
MTHIADLFLLTYISLIHRGHHHRQWDQIPQADLIATIPLSDPALHSVLNRMHKHRDSVQLRNHYVNIFREVIVEWACGRGWQNWVCSGYSILISCIGVGVDDERACLTIYNQGIEDSFIYCIL